MIFNIQRYSIHDGEGIRTIVFFKGCPLRCVWCSNPESQAFGPEVLFDPAKCIACEECVHVAQNGEFIVEDGKILIQRERMTNPLIFQDICPTKALTVVGKDLSVQEVLEEVRKDLPFYKNSGGGVTLSGGEPFAQPEFLDALLQELKRLDIHISVETCLHVPWNSIERNAAAIDVFLADLKHTDAVKFEQYTGGKAALVLENLKKLEANNANVIIRIPVIPGFNHTEDEMRSLLDFTTSLNNVSEVHFIPYHTLGSHKYTLLGREYEGVEAHLGDGPQQASVHEEELTPYLVYAAQLGLFAKIGG
jgi:pyruvate formate lyase activating enzyme